MATLGVDGSPGGWIGALVSDVLAGDGRAHVQWLSLPDAGAILAVDASTVGIDIPIGLPEHGPRRCDVEARCRVGPRASSVFPAPVRPVLKAQTYAEARAILAERGGSSISAHAFGIVPKVRDVDIAMTPALNDRVVEVHPEVSFRALAGQVLPPKKSAAGVGRRIAALDGWVDTTRALTRVPGKVGIDDALDALVCAWSAARWRRGQADVLGDADDRDPRGMPMRIVC